VPSLKSTTARSKRLGRLELDRPELFAAAPEQVVAAGYYELTRNFYGTETKALVRATTRNRGRFPEDFAFRLMPEEWRALRCQIGTSNEGRGGRRRAVERGVKGLSR
jgi:hypothetical protein